MLHNILVSDCFMEDINTRYDPFFSIFEDENAEDKQNNDLSVNYSTNYHCTEGNELTEHPLMSDTFNRGIKLCNVEENNHLRNALMNSF